MRMDKAEQRALVDTNIEKELLDRLKLGTYGELYEDLVNLNKKVFDQMLENEEAVPRTVRRRVGGTEYWLLFL